MNKQLDAKQLKTILFKRVLSTVIGENINQNPKLVGSICDKLGLTYESQLEVINNGKPSVMNAYMKSIMTTIDSVVDDYVINHNGVIRTPYDGELALEAAMEEIVEESDADNLGGTLADMIVDLAERTSNQIKDMAKYVLRLEKNSQDSKKEELLDENAEIEEENQDNGGDSPFEEGDEDGGSEGGESSEDDDPFAGDDSGEGANNQSSAGNGDNPFDESGDSDDGESSDDPFGSTGETQQGETSGEENPFDDGPNGEQKEDQTGSNTKSENPFESVDRIGEIMLSNGKRPFYGLESGELTEFVISNTKEIFYEQMKEVFETHGMESAEYKDLVGKFAKTNKVAMETVIGVISFCSLLGLKYDIDAIRHSDLNILNR